MTEKVVGDGTPDDAAIAEFLRDMAPAWLNVPNVVGVSVGRKRRAGVDEGWAVVFDVVAKLEDAPAIVRAGSRRIPATMTVGDHVLPTDVVEGWPVVHGSRLNRCDPVRGGVSVGNRFETGTLGAVVRHNSTGQRVALSNWHVLVNGGVGGATLQPGPSDANPAGGKTALGQVVDEGVIDSELDAAVTTIGTRGADRGYLVLGRA